MSLAAWGLVLGCLAPSVAALAQHAVGDAIDVQQGVDAEAAAVWSLLASARVENASDEEQVVKAIARLGGAAARPTLGIYVGLIAEPDSEIAPDANAVRARPRILLEALRALPRASVLEEVDRLLTTSEDVDLRLELARILGELRGAGALERIVRIAQALDPIQWERTFVQEPLEGAIGGLLAGDARGSTEFANDVQHADPALAAIFVRALVRADAWSSAPVLTRALGRDARLDTCIVDAVARFGDRIAGTLPDVAMARMRFMLDHSDSSVMASAAQTLALLGDAECAPRLIELLDNPDSSRRFAANSALRTLTSVSLAATSGAWRAWLQREEAWLSEALPEIESALTDGDPAALASGIAELQRHGLYRHRGASLLVPLLASEDENIVAFTCAAMPAFRSGVVLPALRGLADHTNPTVREAAQSALARIESASRTLR